MVIVTGTLSEKIAKKFARGFRVCHGCLMGSEMAEIAPRAQGHNQEVTYREPLSFDDGPRSIISIVTGTVSEKIQRAVQTDPELFELSEKELEEKFEKSTFKITLADRRLRYKWWDEYDRAQLRGSRMVIEYIYPGVVSTAYFYNKLLDNPMKMAWLLCPPALYEDKMAEALEFGLEKIRAMLDIKAVKIAGLGASAKEVPDPAVLKLQFEITKYLDERHRGATVQVSKNLNLNADIPKPGSEGPVTQEDLDKIDKEISDLKNRTSGAGPVPNKEKVIDAEIVAS